MPSRMPPNSAADDRMSYRATLVKCLEQTPDLESPAAHHLMLVFQSALRLVASEWIAASSYIERDINSIEWQLENEAVRIDGLKDFLDQLFVGRRRVRKYQALVDGQFELLRAGRMLPEAWRANNAPVILADMRTDFAQVRTAMEKNSQRIAQTIQLIMSVMVVCQGEQSIQQNVLLGFLTVVATLGVPFSAVAGILGMQTRYGPGQADFGKFWRISGIVIGIVFGIGIIFMVTFRFKLYRWVTHG
jgi:Mg2+ and Co2+ transporter CorA